MQIYETKWNSMTAVLEARGVDSVGPQTAGELSCHPPQGTLGSK